MIQITKAAIGPRILSNASNRGPKKTAEMKQNYDAGQRDFNFYTRLNAISITVFGDFGEG